MILKLTDETKWPTLRFPRKWVLVRFIPFNPNLWIANKSNVVAMSKASKKPKLSKGILPQAGIQLPGGDSLRPNKGCSVG